MDSDLNINQILEDSVRDTVSDLADEYREKQSKKKDKDYYILVGITGFLYDLFYTNLLFTNAIFFLLIGLIVSFIYKKMELNLLTNLFLTIFVIVIYQTIFSLSLFIFNVVPVNIKSTLYLISHSLILNIIYGEILYLICKYMPHKRHLN